MTFDDWLSQHMQEFGDSLSYRPPSRVVWDAATKARDAVWQAEIDSHVSAAVANEREAARRAGQSSGDPIVDAVSAKLRQRSLIGQSKYGVTLAQAGLTRLEALRHAQEEALDLANYLETLIQQEPIRIALLFAVANYLHGCLGRAMTESESRDVANDLLQRIQIMLKKETQE